MAQPRTARAGLVFIWGILGFALVGLAVLLFRGEPEGDAYEAQRAEARSKTLAEIQEAAHAKLTRYEWADKEKGVVRIPIERAMELAVTELSEKGFAPSAEKADIIPSLVVPPYEKAQQPTQPEAAPAASPAAPAAPAAAEAPAAGQAPAAPAASPAPAAPSPAAPAAQPGAQGQTGDSGVPASAEVTTAPALPSQN